MGRSCGEQTRSGCMLAIICGRVKTPSNWTDSRMPDTIAIVTGGLRGLGRAMALGLLEQGHRVTAVGHMIEDVAELLAQAGAMADRLFSLVADLRKPAECDRVFAESRGRFGGDPL